MLRGEEFEKECYEYLKEKYQDKEFEDALR